MSALQAWRERLEAWAIPPQILDAAPESPYGFPTALFRARGSHAVADREATPTTSRALEALPPLGSVLDVGCGGGATSLPLAGRAGVIVGVDVQQDMLDGFGSNARATGVQAGTVLGRWPDVAENIDPVEVAVVGHVLYNVADLEPFVRALVTVTGRRVVFELTERHPLHWMNDLWSRFHGLARPDGPSSDDAAAAIAELGVEPKIEYRSSPPGPGGFDRREDALALVRRRLCLDPSRDEDIERALGDRLQERDGGWNVGPTGLRSIATIWFDQPESSAFDRDE